MKFYFSISLQQLPKTVRVTFGDCQENHVRNFPQISCEWLNPFLKEHALESLEDQKNNFSGQLTLTQESFLYRVSGSLKFSPMLECVRCLERFRTPLVLHPQGSFMPEEKAGQHKMKHINTINADEDIEITADDLDVYFYKNNQIFLDEFLLDQLELALPELPLCKEDCKGLCSSCGAELNSVEICPKKDTQCRHFDSSTVH